MFLEHKVFHMDRSEHYSALYVFDYDTRGCDTYSLGLAVTSKS